MGLDVSHDCWNGAYSAFMRFRSNLAAAIGIDIMNMENFGGKQIPWPSKTDEPLALCGKIAYAFSTAVEPGYLALIERR